MKQLLCLLGLLALAPLAARAQSYPYSGNSASDAARQQQQMRNASAEESYRQQNLRTAQMLQGQNNQANQTTGGPRGPLFRKPNYLGYFSGRDAKERRAHRESKAADRAYKADIKAHGGTHRWPGGYRYDPKTGAVIRPDGTVAGSEQATQPAQKPSGPKQGTINGRTETDDLKALEKVQSFDKWRAEKEKAQAKPVR